MSRKAPNDIPRKKGERTAVGQLHELQIHLLDDEGYGRGTLAGRAVAIGGAFTGETVRARLTHLGQQRIWAEVKEVITPSPDRVTPLPCAAGCDACPFTALGYGAQLNWKEGLVAAALAEHPVLKGATLRPVLPSPRQNGYRTVAKLVVGGTWSRPVIGVYRRNSHDLVDLGNCPLHHPLINRVVQAARVGIRKVKLPIYHPASGRGVLRYLVVRVAEESGEALVVLVTADRNYGGVHHLAKHLQASVAEVKVVGENDNTSGGNVIFGSRDHLLTRQRAITETIGGVRLIISPRSFFQVNRDAARLVYETVAEFASLTGSEQVLDLYSGIGGISLTLARQSREVIGMEVVREAVVDATASARLNGVRNCRFVVGDVAELLSEGFVGEVDVVVLNPPRRGCDAAVLRRVAALAPVRIVYVSCAPRALARDLELLAGLGYRTDTIQPVDMFPQTPHVESVALLLRNQETGEGGLHRNNSKQPAKGHG